MSPQTYFQPDFLLPQIYYIDFSVVRKVSKYRRKFPTLYSGPSSGAHTALGNNGTAYMQSKECDLITETVNRK